MLWRWLFRPLIVIFFGAATVKAIEANPAAGLVISLVSFLLFASLIIDILKTLNEVFHLW